MANIPINTSALAVSGSGAITGSFAGFTVPTSVTFTALKDANNTVLATPANPLVFGASSFVPLNVTSASISLGAAIFYI
jgi:hypothetical protein